MAISTVPIDYPSETEMTESVSEPCSEPETELESTSTTEPDSQDILITGELLSDEPIPGFQVRFGLKQNEINGWVITVSQQEDEPQDFSINYMFTDSRFEIRSVEIDEQHGTPYRCYCVYDNERMCEYQIIQVLRKDFRFDWWFELGYVYRWYTEQPYSFVYGNSNGTFFERFWDDGNYVMCFEDPCASTELNTDVMNDHALMTSFLAVQ